MVNDFRPFGSAMAKLSTQSRTIERDDGREVALPTAIDNYRRIDTEPASRMLSTGVDVQTCKLIVLEREVGSMTEFKQILGRGTRVREDMKKFYINGRRVQIIAERIEYLDEDGKLITERLRD